MATLKFEFKIEGFKSYAALLRPGLFEKLSRQHVDRATQQNAVFLATAMRKTIQTSEGLSPNAQLTMDIKGSSKPLVGIDSDLFNGITHKRINSFAAFAGVLRTNEAFNVAVGAHEGFTMAVTPKIRGLFWFLHLASTGQIPPSRLTGRAAELFQRKSSGWKPLAESTTQIVIKGRPFVTITLANQALKDRMYRNWHRAMGFVWRDMKRRFLSG
jgi:hypothetical protein